MRKSFSYLAASILAFSAVGCVVEKEGAEGVIDIDEGQPLQLVVGSNNATKSNLRKTKATSVVRETIPFDKVDGETIYLQESVQDMDDKYFSNRATTKGAPIFTEGFGYKYPTFGALAYGYSTATTSTELSPVSGLTEYTGGKTKSFYLDYDDAETLPLIYKYDFASGIWAESDPANLLFFLSAPNMSASVSAGVKSIDYYYTKTGAKNGANNGVIKFKYQSPEKVADQTDILFTSKSMDRASYNANNLDGSSILFYHTLAGVKFKTGNGADGVKILKVQISGINNEGTCTVTPQFDADGYVLSADDYSNANASTDRSKTVSQWTERTGSGTFSIGDGVNPIAINSASNDTDGNHFSSSFIASTNNKDNLMDAAFENTFFFIPQETPSGAEITLTYSIAGTVHEKTVSLAGRKWYAGEIYTYTLTARELGIFIEDEMSADNAVKSNIEITNTRNIPAYIRVAVAGNWYDSHEYTTGGAPAPGHIIVNQAWQKTDYAEGESPINFNREYWIESGGYWYYKYKINSGVTIPASRTIFTQYVTPDSKTIKNDGGVHLEMSIAVQAVDADKIDMVTWWPEAVVAELKDILDNGTVEDPASNSGEGE